MVKLHYQLFYLLKRVKVRLDRWLSGGEPALLQ